VTEGFELPFELAGVEEPGAASEGGIAGAAGAEESAKPGCAVIRANTKTRKNKIVVFTLLINCKWRA